MKRIIYYFGTSIVVVFCLHCLLLISFLWFNGQDYSSSLSFSIKRDYAESIKEPRILIIGGSNVRYNISAAQISQQIDIPTVNLGTTAGVMIPYMLEQLTPIIREGDIILLPLEYSVYRQTESMTSDVVLYVTSVNPHWFVDNPHKALEVIFEFGLVQLAKANAINIFLDYDSVRSQEPMVNKFGDQKNTHPQNQTYAMLSQLEERLQATPKTLSFNKKARKVLTKFIMECHQKKATVVLTYPCHFYYDEYREKAFEDFILELGAFAWDLGVPVVGTPQDFLFEDKALFWDTLSHMNQAGRDIATERMIELLKEFLKKHRNQSEH